MFGFANAVLKCFSGFRTFFKPIYSRLDSEICKPIFSYNWFWKSTDALKNKERSKLKIYFHISDPTYIVHLIKKISPS